MHALAYAEALVRYRESFGEGDLDKAISAARKAYKAWPQNSAALFWEGCCHHLAGRPKKAAESLQLFLDLTEKSSNRRVKAFRQKALAISPE